MLKLATKGPLPAIIPLQTCNQCLLYNLFLLPSQLAVKLYLLTEGCTEGCTAWYPLAAAAPVRAELEREDRL